MHINSLIVRYCLEHQSTYVAIKNKIKHHDLHIILLLCIIPCVLSNPILSFQRIDLPSTAVGPFSVAYDRYGRGPFTGISDGRIVRYDALQQRFIDFAFTGPDRTKEICDGTNNNDDASMGGICGRPLGLVFYYKTNEMYVTDAYHGLMLVPASGRLASTIATGAQGLPFKFIFHLEVDQRTGDVYFTEFSTRYNISQVQEALDARDATGRLLKYTRRTGEVTVLLRNLSGASGVVMSHDMTHLIVAEFVGNTTKKFWLSGPNALTATHLTTFLGRPVNIKRNILPRDYWVGLTRGYRLADGTVFRDALAVRFRGDGRQVQTLNFSAYYPNATVSEYNPIGLLSGYVCSLRSSALGRVN